MSASREKKYRQDGGTAVKTAKMDQETAERKRKTLQYTIIAVVVVVLVAALLIWNSGFFQRMLPALKVGDETLSAAELTYYYGSYRSSYLNQLYYYYSSYSQMGLTSDMNLPSDDDVYNSDTGETFREYYMEQAVTAAAQQTAVYNDAVAKGFHDDTIADTLKTRIDSYKSSASTNGLSYEAYLRSTFGNLITKSAFEKLEERSLIVSAYIQQQGDVYYDGYTDTDLEAYYSDHVDSLDTYVYSTICISPETVEEEDEDGNELPEEEVTAAKEAAAAAAKSKAEMVQDAYNNGSSIEELIETYTPTSSNDHTVAIGSSSISTIYLSNLLAMEDGDSELVESSDSWYFVVLHERYRDETPTVDFHNLLVKAETTTADNKTVAPSGKAWATAEEELQGYLNEFNAGDKSEASFAALADEHSDDTQTEGGLYERVPKDAVTNSAYYTSYRTVINTEVMDWLYDESRKPGDVSEPLKHEGDVDGTSQYWGYNAIYYIGQNEPVWKDTVRSTLTTEDLQEWRDGLTSNYPTEIVGNVDSIGR